MTSAAGAGPPARETPTEDLIAQSLHAESMYTEWRHQVRHGLKQLQNSSVAFFRQTELFRVYSSSLVPGLLQTEGTRPPSSR